MTIKAKLKVDSVLKTEYGETVKLTAVYSPDQTTENYTYSKYTPVANFELSITNTAVHGFFVPGQEYVLDINHSPKEVK